MHLKQWAQRNVKLTGLILSPILGIGLYYMARGVYVLHTLNCLEYLILVCGFWIISNKIYKIKNEIRMSQIESRTNRFR